MRKHTRPTVALCAAVVGLGALTACSQSPKAASTTQTTPTPQAAVVVDDAWIKAAPSGMTAIFGTLRNPTTQPVTVVSATTSVSDRAEMHEVVGNAGQMVMQQKPGGFVIPANGSHALKPGGDHIMVLDLDKPVVAGEQVTATLTLADGTTVRITALAKDTTAGEEKYHSTTAPMP